MSPWGRTLAMPARATRTLVAMTMCVSVIATQPVAAKAIFLAGANANTDADLYGYVGAVLPMGTTLDKEGFLLRLWADGVSYDYSTTLAARKRSIDGNGFGLEAEIGYQWLGDVSRISVYLGPRYRYTDLDPEDPTNDADNENLGIKGQLELLASMSKQFELSAMGSYVLGLDDYWMRLRPRYLWDDRLAIGPEIAFAGGEKYDKQQLGLFASGYRLGEGSLGVKLGVERDAREDQLHGYLGVDFSQLF